MVSTPTDYEKARAKSLANESKLLKSKIAYDKHKDQQNKKPIFKTLGGNFLKRPSAKISKVNPENFISRHLPSSKPDNTPLHFKKEYIGEKKWLS